MHVRRPRAGVFFPGPAGAALPGSWTAPRKFCPSTCCGGNDILYYASRYLSQALDDQRYASPEIVGRYMNEGRNGLRDGKGFHDWSGTDVGAYRRSSTARIVDLLRLADKLPVFAD
ncbi:MAG: hypothetical protein NDI67_00335 [Sulfuritalea sp.]|nr:hypothetical protein [Sulfuritalea sp.]